MGKVIRDPRLRRPKVPPKSLLLAQVEFLARECAESHATARGFGGRICEARRDRAAQAPGGAKPLAVLHRMSSI